MATKRQNTIEECLNDLCSGLKRYVAKFDKKRIFTGPSLYFHRRTIQRLRSHQSPAAAIQHDDFVESLYATLASWGMHRMGPKGAKLREYQTFKAGLLQHQDEI